MRKIIYAVVSLAAAALYITGTAGTAAADVDVSYSSSTDLVLSVPDPDTWQRPGDSTS
ncbi:hypothetical protein ACFVQ4_34210 [Streptomyces laurentii]|uniref:hypothetical protein n=1 Tax=Streptomyces laurentii TaxID=39478 RepID=UPI00369F503E